MLVVQVHVKVRPEAIDAFKSITMENARNSLRERGIARFDVLQHNEDPTMFILSEAYRDAGAPALHKETEHYKKWRDAVEGMMAEPRSSIKYTNVFPTDESF